MNDDNSTCRAVIPDVNLYLPSLSIAYVVVFALFGLFTLLTLLLYCDVILYLLRHHKDCKSRRSAQVVLTVYPVLSCTGYVSLLVPRSSALNDLIAAMYVSSCVYVFVGMLVELYGGPSQMIVRLAGSKIEFSVPPLCCLFRCLPRIDVTSTRLRMLRLLVLQYAVVRPLLGYVIAVMWSEISYGKTAPMRAPTNYMNLIYLFSSLMATWGLVMIYRMSHVPLQYAEVRPKFICFQVVVIISGIQRPFFTVLVMAEVLTCEFPLSVEGTADRWNHLMLVAEMLLLMSVARVFYRRQSADDPHTVEPDVLTMNEVLPEVTTTTSAVDDQLSSEYQDRGSTPGAHRLGTGYQLFGVDEWMEQQLDHVTLNQSTVSPPSTSKTYGSIVPNSVNIDSHIDVPPPRLIPTEFEGHNAVKIGNF